VKWFNSLKGRLLWSFEIGGKVFKSMVPIGFGLVFGFTFTGLFRDGSGFMASFLWAWVAGIVWIAFISVLLILASPPKRDRIGFRPHYWDYCLDPKIASLVDMLVMTDDPEEKFHIASMIVGMVEPNSVQERKWHKYATDLSEYKKKGGPVL